MSVIRFQPKGDHTWDVFRMGEDAAIAALYPDVNRMVLVTKGRGLSALEVESIVRFMDSIKLAPLTNQACGYSIDLS